MAKGFSFILVSVVMTVMMIFGMLTLSGANAGLRLSQKAADTQRTYYRLDSRAETSLSECENAAGKAGGKADAFMSGGGYRQPPPDFYASRSSLAAAVSASPDPTGSNYKLLRRAAFIYYLEKELASVNGVKISLPDSVINSLASGSNPAGELLTVSSSFGEDGANITLNVTLACLSQSLDTTPRFSVKEWKAGVAGEEMIPSHIDVWEGQ